MNCRDWVRQFPVRPWSGCDSGNSDLPRRSHPDVRVVDHMLPCFPPQLRRFVQAGIPMLFDYRRPIGDGLLKQHYVGLRLVNVLRRVVFVLAEVGAAVRSGNAADQIVIDGSDVQKILRKGALVLLL